MALATMMTSGVVVPMAAAIAISRRSVTFRRLGIFGLWALLAFLIIGKAIMIDGRGTYIFKDLFLITTLSIFMLVRVNKAVLAGVVVGFIPIALLDATSNLMQLFLGQGLFGTTVSGLRDDGARLTGIFGSSFFSLSIYLVTTLGMQAVGFRRTFSRAFLLMMLLVGSLRAYVLPLLFITYRFVFRFAWPMVFIFSVLVSISVAVATFYSVHLGYFSDISGNSYRLFAWASAFSSISEAPILGADVPPPVIPPEVGINQDNIVYYQVFESTMLQDAVRYGVPFVVLKFIFFYQIGKTYFARGALRSGSTLAVTKNVVVSLMVTDYVIFSFFGMPLMSLIAGLILATEEPRRR